MNDLELIFTMLGEASTKEIIEVHDTQWFTKIQEASRSWGDVAKIARENLESKTGNPIVNKNNHVWNVSLEDII